MGANGVVKEFQIRRVENGQAQDTKDSVVVESRLSLYLNGGLLTEFFCTPCDLDALVLGYLCGQGLIDRKEDLKSLAVAGERAEAILREGHGPEHAVLFPLARRRAAGGIRIPVEELLDAVADFNAESPLFASTGGTHSCALCWGENSRIFVEDIGRHNAFDKAVGKALLDDRDISTAYLIASGRLQLHTVQKAVRVGLQVLVSRSAPTSLAVELARSADTTLCGFARGRRVNIYSGAHRILTG